MIPVYSPSLGEEELNNVIHAIKTNWISSKGEFIGEFEKKFAEYCGASYGIATCNGTSALHLALESLGIKSGHEVIVPNFTMISSALAVCYTGAKPVFVDAEEDTYNINPDKIEEKITARTKAIMPVHIYGHPCDMDKIKEIAKKHNLFVVEDAAEAHGAEYNGKKAGSLGDIGCFSFYGNKLITTGEGGMIITNSKEIYEKAQSLKNLAFGKDNRYLHEEIGFNYRMTNLQAAIGLAQLKKINSFLEIKRKNAKIYTLLLKNLKGMITPIEKEYAKNSYWMYGIRFNEEFGFKKDKIREYLFKKGVDTRDFFIGMNEQPIFKRMGLQNGEYFPVSKKLSETGIYIPFGLNLKAEELDYVCDCIREIGKNGL